MCVYYLLFIRLQYEEGLRAYPIHDDGSRPVRGDFWMDDARLVCLLHIERRDRADVCLSNPRRPVSSIDDDDDVDADEPRRWGGEGTRRDSSDDGSKKIREP